MELKADICGGWW